MQQTIYSSTRTHPTDEEFIPQILVDFEAKAYGDVLTAVGTSAMIAAEAALHIMEQRGPAVAKRFLELITHRARG